MSFPEKLKIYKTTSTAARHPHLATCWMLDKPYENMLS